MLNSLLNKFISLLHYLIHIHILGIFRFLLYLENFIRITDSIKFAMIMGLCNNFSFELFNCLNIKFGFIIYIDLSRYLHYIPLTTMLIRIMTLWKLLKTDILLLRFLHYLAKSLRIGWNIFIDFYNFLKFWIHCCKQTSKLFLNFGLEVECLSSLASFA